MTFEQHATPGQWAAVIAMLHASGGQHHAPLFEAAAAGRITLDCTTGRASRATLPGWSSRPAIVLVADDDGQPTGPAGWACRDQLARWARSALIHGTGGLAWHYEAAIEAAATMRRVLIVDTTSGHVAAWAALLAGKPTVLIQPPAGLVHPDRPPTVH